MLAGLSAVFSQALAADTRVRVTSMPDHIRIEIDGELFTEYRFRGGPKPYLLPIRGADGTPLTRDVPMAAVPGEERDHPHHRSLWFAHGAVNGHEFWSERSTAGKIFHDALLETRSGVSGLFRAQPLGRGGRYGGL